MKIGRLWLIIAAACVVPAALDGSLTYVQGVLAGRPPSWPEVFWQANEWLILGALTPLVYWLARRYPLRPPILGRNLLAHVGGALLLCIGWATAGASLRWALGIGPTQITKTQHLTGWLLTTIPWGTFMYFTTLGCMHAFAYFVEAKEREAQSAPLAAQVAESRLGALRMQLHPHFLFNSLNAIAVLVREQNTAAASRMLELLGDVLRQVLKTDQVQEIPLADELSFLERYLEIEQVRFSDRLRVHWSIEPAARAALVPGFVLQPIVENAVKHGVARRADAGRLDISARIDRGSLELTVEDDGVGFSASQKEGVGLSNTRERLATMYGDAAGLTIAGSVSGGTRVVLRLPFRPRT